MKNSSKSNIDRNAGFKAGAKIFANALKKVDSNLYPAKDSKNRFKKYCTLEKSCVTIPEPVSRLNAKLQVKTKPKMNAFVANKEHQCSSQPAISNRKIKSKENIEIDNSCKQAELTQSIKVSQKVSEKLQASKIIAPISCKYSKRIEESSKDHETSKCISTLIAASSNSFQVTEGDSRPLPYSKSMSDNSGYKSFIHELENHTSQLKIDPNIFTRAASLLSVSNESLEHDLENHTDQPSTKSAISNSLSDESGYESFINELKNHTNESKIDYNIYTKVASPSNESLEHDLENHTDQPSITCNPHTNNNFSSFYNHSKSECKNSNQIQHTFYHPKTSFSTSPMSSNSSGYCSTPQSNSFLELENNKSSFLLPTDSSYSPSNNLDSEFVTHEYTLQNSSNFGNQYFSKKNFDDEVQFFQSPSSKNLIHKLEKQINKFPLKMNTSVGVESIQDEKIETKPVNEKVKKSNYSKSNSEDYAFRKLRTTNKPKTCHNSTYKTKGDGKLNQHNLEKSMYIYEENNKSSDTSKWEALFSSRPNSQFQNCSSQRITATKIQKMPIKNPVPSKDFIVEYPVDRLLSFNEGTFIDAHCHLDFLLDKVDYKKTFTDYRRDFSNEFPPSYGGCVTVFCNPLSFSRTLQWKKLLSDEYIWAAFGCHPKKADHYSDSVEDSLCSALSHPQVCALGEIGLDYSDRSMCSKSKQKEVFKRQLKIGLAFDLPLVIHCRDAYDDCLEILKEFVPCNYPIHLHCFTSEWNIAQRYLEVFPNLCIGVTNVITFKSSWEVQEVVRNIPLDRLLLETDAPYFIPRTHSSQFKVSHPGMAIFVAAKVASLKNIPLNKVLMQTRKNTRKVYNI